MPELVPERCIGPLVVDCPVERPAPGAMRQRGDARLVAAEGERKRGFAELSDAEHVTVRRTDDFRSAMWKKLCFNVAGVVPALLGVGDGAAREEAIAEVMLGRAREAAGVASAAVRGSAELSPIKLARGAGLRRSIASTRWPPIASPAARPRSARATARSCASAASTASRRR